MVTRSLKFHKKGVHVFRKITATFEFLVANYQTGISSDMAQKMLSVLLRLQLNGNVAQDKDLIARIEVVSVFADFSFAFSKDVQRAYSKILADRRYASSL